jgi:hypothetical protein
MPNTPRAGPPLGGDGIAAGGGRAAQPGQHGPPEPRPPEQGWTAELQLTPTIMDTVWWPGVIEVGRQPVHGDGPPGRAGHAEAGAGGAGMAARHIYGWELNFAHPTCARGTPSGSIRAGGPSGRHVAGGAGAGGRDREPGPGPFRPSSSTRAAMAGTTSGGGQVAPAGVQPLSRGLPADHFELRRAALPSGVEAEPASPRHRFRHRPRRARQDDGGRRDPASPDGMAGTAT